MTGTDLFEIFIWSWAGFWLGMVVGYMLAVATTKDNDG